MTIRPLAALAALLAVATTARAQELDSDSRERQQAALERMRELAAKGVRPEARGQAARHDGFYFRAESGFGYTRFGYALVNDVKVSGAGPVGALHLGGAVHPGILLGIQTWASTVSSGTMSAGSQSTSGYALGTLGVGPELTVYFQPANIYVTSAVGLTWLTMAQGGGSDTSRSGLGARLSAGTEWWLTPRWGLGLAAVAGFSTNVFEAKVPQFVAPISMAFQAWTLGAALSMTYN